MKGKNKFQVIKNVYDEISTPDEKAMDIYEIISEILEDIKRDNEVVKNIKAPTKEELKSIIHPIVKSFVEKKFEEKQILSKEEVIEFILNNIPPPKKGIDGNKITPKEVVAKLKSMKGDEGQLSVFDLKDVEWLKGKGMQWSSAGFKVYTDGTTITGDGSFGNPLKATNSQSGGGSLATDTVSGTINGTNKVFTIPSSFTSSSFISLNGQIQIQNVDYTVSGTTVTYANAPSADLSGLTHIIIHT